MSGTATITAPIGPAVTATSLVFTGIRSITFDTLLASVAVMKADGTVVTFDAKATATITATASSGVFTFTVSQ